MYVSPITDALINILSDVWRFMARNFELYYFVTRFIAVVTFRVVSIYTEYALRLCRMKKCCKLYDPPWKNIIITGTSVGLSFRMQILSAHTASVILVLVQIVYCVLRGTVKRESGGSLCGAWGHDRRGGAFLGARQTKLDVVILWPSADVWTKQIT